MCAEDSQISGGVLFRFAKKAKGHLKPIIVCCDCEPPLMHQVVLKKSNNKKE